MINTSWEDDGEALKGLIWHGHAWAAECAWNGSNTEPAAFNRRVGAVLFGEKGDHFGQAIALLAKTHALPGMAGMNNSRFWQDDFFSTRGAAELQAEASRLLPLVQQAAEHLKACRRDATVNVELLDSFQFGTRRMDLIGRRMLDGLEAKLEYASACRSSKPQSLEHLARVEEIVRRTRDAHETLAREFARLWLRDCRPYALDWTIRRYQKAIDRYDALLLQIGEAQVAGRGGQALAVARRSRAAACRRMMVIHPAAWFACAKVTHDVPSSISPSGVAAEADAAPNSERPDHIEPRQ